jgi:hypothetical protein
MQQHMDKKGRRDDVVRNAEDNESKESFRQGGGKMGTAILTNKPSG